MLYLHRRKITPYKTIFLQNYDTFIKSAGTKASKGQKRNPVTAFAQIRAMSSAKMRHFCRWKGYKPAVPPPCQLPTAYRATRHASPAGVAWGCAAFPCAPSSRLSPVCAGGRAPCSVRVVFARQAGRRLSPLTYQQASRHPSASLNYLARNPQERTAWATANREGADGVELRKSSGWLS